MKNYLEINLETNDPDLSERIRIDVKQIRIPSSPPYLLPVPTVPVEPLGTEMRVIHSRKSVTQSDDRRIVHYAADHSGCGWWRLNLIEQLVNYTKKGHITHTDILMDPFKVDYWGRNVIALRIQRLVRPETMAYMRDLRSVIEHMRLPLRLIYEMDDVVLGCNIPSFNISKSTFERDEIQKSIIYNIKQCDEFTVCSEYMRDVYQEFLPHTNITVIPNFATKEWFGHVYDYDYIMRKYEEHKKRPRVLLTCSGTHFIPWNTNPYDSTDYSHVLDDMIAARKDFEFVWFGSYPNLVQPFIDSGEMEAIHWGYPTDYPWTIKEAGCQLSIAALIDNDFNRAKSAIKFEEACFEGLPFVGQDLNCYKDAFHKFNSGAEMIDLMKSVVKDEETYSHEVLQARAAADNWWMDDKVDDILKVYTTPFGDESRNAEWFKKLNG